EWSAHRGTRAPCLVRVLRERLPDDAARLLAACRRRATDRDVPRLDVRVRSPERVDLRATRARRAAALAGALPDERRGARRWPGRLRLGVRPESRRLACARPPGLHPP